MLMAPRVLKGPRVPQAVRARKDCKELAVRRELQGLQALLVQMEIRALPGPPVLA